MKIKMLTTVYPDFPFAFVLTGTKVLYEGHIYRATANKHGAVCGICDNGEILGVKPYEFKFVSLPQWLFDIWAVAYPEAVDGAVIEENNEKTDG